MICNQLSDATNALFLLTPKPAVADIARIVCGNCDRVDRCPSLSLEQAESIHQNSGQSEMDANT